ncbi:hypothetical protein KBA27_00305 [bacterium]|nr:hypothetical protein [bacterium]
MTSSLSTVSPQMQKAYSVHLDNIALQGGEGDKTFLGLGPIGQQSIFNSAPGEMYFGPYATDFEGQGCGMFPSVDYSGMGMGAGMGMGMYGGAYGMGSGYCSTPQQYAAYQKTYAQTQQDLALQNMQFQRNMQKLGKQYSLEDRRSDEAFGYEQSASDAKINQCLANLNYEIKENNQDNVGASYDKLRSAVTAKLKKDGITNLNAGEVDAQTQVLYQQQFGSNVPDDITKYGDTAFVHGLKNPFGCLGNLFGVSKTEASDNVAKITHGEKPEGEKSQHTAGVVAGSVATVLAIPVVALSIKALKSLKK